MGGFWTDISNCSEGEGDQIFFYLIFHRDIRNKKTIIIDNEDTFISAAGLSMRDQCLGQSIRKVLRPSTHATMLFLILGPQHRRMLRACGSTGGDGLRERFSWMKNSTSSRYFLPDPIQKV